VDALLLNRHGRIGGTVAQRGGRAVGSRRYASITLTSLQNLGKQLGNGVGRR
jgi:hypothetical protein